MSHKQKQKIKIPEITYEVVGTQKENEEIMDRIFKVIFDEVMKRREERSKGIDIYRHKKVQ